MKREACVYLPVLIAGALGVGMALKAATGSIPIHLAYLRCLQPVTCSYRIPTAAAGDLAQEGIVFEEVLANSGVPEPVVRMQPGRVEVSTHAASQPDAERLDGLIRLHLALRYRDYRPIGAPNFKGSHRYGKQAMDVVAARLKLAGYEQIQYGLRGANGFWVSVHTLDHDFEWAWHRLGLFEIRLLPPGYSVLVYPGERGTPWRPAQGTVAEDARQRRVNLALLVRRSRLIASNVQPFEDARVEEVHGPWGMFVSLPPSTAARMKEMSARSAGRAVALVWDSVVIAAPAVRSPTGSKFTMETGFRGDAGYREAQQLAACLRSGSAPVPLTEAPPEVELPKSVTYFLRRAYPRCRLLTYDDYGPGMWSGLFAELRRRLASYREHDHPFAVSGDFDANGKNDWAFLLKCGQKVRLVALHHAGTTWKPHLVSEAFYQNGFQVGVGGFSVYLEPAHKGKSRGNWELGRLVVLPRDGFEEVFAEKAAWLWLWDGKKYTRFVSRD